MKYAIQVVFGEEACQIHEEDGFHAACEFVKNHDGVAETLLFKTKEAAEAYKRGVNDCLGWMGASMSIILPVPE